MISLSLKHESVTHTRRELKLIDEAEIAQLSQEYIHVDDEEYLDSIPLLEGDGADSTQQYSVFHIDPYGTAAEQFRLMQRRLSNLRPAGGSVLLTSPGIGDGKTTNANNLAWALAEAGHSTLLLELDLRRPALHRYLPENPPYDLNDVLLGDVSGHAAVRRLHELPLFYLGVDKPAARPIRLLRSKKLTELIRWANQTFSWVVIDGPPVVGVSDVEEILPKVDLALMVVRERGTPRAMLERAAERMGERLNFVIYNDALLSDSYGQK
ncbi:CpsD/CapB family tyrosine-protein kinase [Terriglobus sp. TAA 43]|uniref:tyrosine-protein kinase family protein n=1 Tax=Terriglobus sp. TAA 43 TaxID=278961 RepID=UPI00064790E3|nr:CpsD/CapB family tyrosine-protein kinase [Terriglobus sp. TAA 43]